MRSFVLVAAGLVIGSVPVNLALDAFPLNTVERNAETIRAQIADGMAAAAPVAAPGDPLPDTRY